MHMLPRSFRLMGWWGRNGDSVLVQGSACRVQEASQQARKMLLSVAERGLPGCCIQRPFM